MSHKFSLVNVSCFSIIFVLFIFFIVCDYFSQKSILGKNLGGWVELSNLLKELRSEPEVAYETLAYERKSVLI